MELVSCLGHFIRVFKLGVFIGNVIQKKLIHFFIVLDSDRFIGMAFYVFSSSTKFAPIIHYHITKYRTLLLTNVGLYILTCLEDLTQL